MPVYEINETLHKIKVKLYRNNLPNANGAYYARPANEAVLSVEDIAAALKKRGGYTGSYSDLVQRVKLFFMEMARQLCDGYAVNTGWFSVQPVISGFFKSDKEGFDPKEHKVSFRYRTGNRLRKLAQNTEIEMEGKADVAGKIGCFTDVDSGAVNQTITPGGLFRIDGRKIKVKGEGKDCGVWFVSKAGPHKRYKVKRALAENAKAKVIGMVPALPAGEYGVEIVTCYTVGGNELKTPKTIKSGFTVVANS